MACVRIGAEAPGLTTVTLTATDSDDLSASLVFAVNVKGPPRVVGEIAALSLPAGALADIDAAARFRDPNGDELAYQAASSNASAAAATMDGSVARVVAKVPGTATVTITAADGDGLSASLSFSVGGGGAASEPGAFGWRRRFGDAAVEPVCGMRAALMSPAASSSDTALVAADVADGVLTLAAVGEDEGAAVVSVGGDGRRRLAQNAASPGRGDHRRRLFQGLAPALDHAACAAGRGGLLEPISFDAAMTGLLEFYDVE